MSSDELEVPKGCRAATIEGWPADKPVEYVRVGPLLLPKRFYMAVYVEDLPGIAVLHFEVESGEVTMPVVWGIKVDVHAVLDALRKIRPIDFWRRLAISEMVKSSLRGLNPVDDSTGTENDFFSMVERLAPGTLSAAARDVPLRSHRRNRITTDHLREVARVYQAADDAGQPPTRAVADHFGASHSTAARWVGLARKQEMLPPAQAGAEKEE